MNNIIIPEDLRKSMMRTAELVPYIGNAKKHPDWQVEQIANSIQAFGFNDPIAYCKNPVTGYNTIIEGHGRLLAAKKLGMEEVPVINLVHLDDEARRSYTLAHNKLTMNTDFDVAILNSELDAIEGFDMSELGFEEVVPSLESNPKVDFTEELCVLVEVKDESEQELVYNELSESGYKCRLLTL